jgi:cobalamin biosynthesis protein CbiG
MTPGSAPQPRLDPALVALTPHGVELGRRLAQALGRGEVVPAGSGVRDTLAALFEAGRPLVCIMALGIVVRILGPLARDKKSDPGVVVVDEAGRFAVSVLGGHAGGANALAHEVAAALGATAVITTASEVLGLPALDLVGRSRGWKIERDSRLTEVTAAMVRGEAVAVYQDAGNRDWSSEFGDWPANLQRIKTWPQGHWAGLIVISDLWCRAFPYPTLIYRPPTLVLGVGCRRGVPCAEIDALFQYVCRTRGFSPLSLGMVATATPKANEPGLREFAATHGVPLRAFSLEEIADVADLPTPSEKVREKLGVAGVAEPAAMLGAGTTQLLTPKYTGKRVTMALARREEA